MNELQALCLCLALDALVIEFAFIGYDIHQIAKHIKKENEGE